MRYVLDNLRFNTKLQEFFTCLCDTIMFRHVMIKHFGFIKVRELIK
jgi:hypothetical protein